MVYRPPVSGEPDRTAHQRARGVGRAARFARCQAVRRAGRALATARQERHDDPLPDRQIGAALTDLLDDAGGLVTEQHGHRPHPVAVDDRQIGMA